MAINSQIINLVVFFGILQISNYFDLDNAANVNYLRAGYATMQLVALTAFYLAYTHIQAKNDQTTLTYQEKKNPMDQAPETVRTTVRDYDMGKLKEAVRGQFIAMAIMAFIHFKWFYLRPLLLQSILGLRTIYQAPLVQIHVLGKQAAGDLARPWKAPGPFGQAAKPITEKELKAQEKKEAKKKMNRQD
ncbi:inorganic phosphate transporter [Gaertneriomyces semiglobifer]|nr:inorganic phosphate transporter [Gaertneriomyces semiglobifer]